MKSIIEQQRLWLSNFENLCPYLAFNIDKRILWLKEGLENPSPHRWEDQETWKIEKELFNDTGLMEVISIHWEKVLWQPIWFLDAIKQVPKLSTNEDIKKRFDLIYWNIDRSKAKLDEFYINSISVIIKDMISSNKTGAEKLIFKIISDFTITLEGIEGMGSGYHFNFKESPLFISLYEFINKIKKHYAMINANTKFIIFDEYIETLPELKKKFDLGNLEDAMESKNRIGEFKKRMSIPTKATPSEILNFWLRLQGNNEKGEPYWESKQEIEHFVNQNFEGFEGVDEIKEFNPNMNKTELNHVTWTFLNRNGKSKTKRQYENLLIQNFKKFKDDKNVYSNIKDQNNEHLKSIYK